jgi:UDP-N-acetylmuramyl pentapeptide phosphotransferase/UDP-N-acetylglucosamine-1-phosphate transferase
MVNDLLLNSSVFASLAISLFIGYYIVPRIVFISRKKKLFDFIDNRKVHKDNIPRLGGVSFFPALLFSICFIVAIRYSFNMPIKTELADGVLVEMLFLVCGLILLYFIGLADDLVGVSYKFKLLAQVISAILMISGGVYINDFCGFLGIHAIPAYVGYPLTVLVVIFIINSINLIDGVDGLASGLSSVALISLGSWYLYKDLYMYSMLSFSMIGVIIPFFYYNVFSKRRKIFMGDTGSLMLGYLISFLSIKFCMLTQFAPQYSFSGAPIFILSILFIPLFDSVRVFSERVMQGRFPFYPDKTHIHHKFLALGFSHIQTMSIILLLAIVFAVLNVILARFLSINIMVVIELVLGVIMSCLLHRVKNKA